MDKRFRIGLNYFFDNKSNSGIVNYIYNIVAALKTLDDIDKPAIVVFYAANAPLDYLKSIGYPYIQYILFRQHPSNFFVWKTNSLIRKIIKLDIYKQLTYFNKIDCLYPYFEFFDSAFLGAKNKVHWLVDFNNKAYPGHYADGGEMMSEFQEKLSTTKDRVVLSSNTLINELKTHYPNFKFDVRVLRFASTIPPVNEMDVETVIRKFNINLPYLMSPNQFWEHKNQVVVLEALNVIKRQRPELKFKMLFSGSLEVNRGKGLYIDVLRNKVKEHELDDYVLFLGLLDRNDQLSLMKGAAALLQPSLYEGWSTLVEEAKALSKFIILSDLPVHREQISDNVAFFNPHNAVELAEKIISQVEEPAVLIDMDYKKDIENYSKCILNVLKP